MTNHSEHRVPPAGLLPPPAHPWQHLPPSAGRGHGAEQWPTPRLGWPCPTSLKLRPVKENRSSERVLKEFLSWVHELPKTHENCHCGRSLRVRLGQSSRASDPTRR